MKLEYNRCVFYNSSTKPNSDEKELPKKCNPPCDGHDYDCKTYINKHTAKDIAMKESEIEKLLKDI